MDINSHYVLSVCDVMSELMTPLREVDIYHFDYLKIFPDERHFCMSNDKSWLQQLYQQQAVNSIFNEVLQTDMEFSIQCHFKCAPDGLAEHDVFIVLTHRGADQVIERSCFGATSKKYQANWYLNHWLMLDKFVRYFKVHAHQEIAIASQPDNLMQNPVSVAFANNCNSLLEQLGFDQLPVAVNQELQYLSKRELQCLALIVRGMSSKKIASILSISPRTVEVHLENARLKLGCHNRAELTALLMDWFYIRRV